jgi:hypothetical protein
MTNHRAGKSNAKDPRGNWRAGKDYKADTARYVQRQDEADKIEEQLDDVVEDLVPYIGLRARRLFRDEG